MNQRMSPEPLSTEDAAAFWFARVCSAQMTDVEKMQFESWKQDPANGHAYQTLQGIWNATTLVPAARLRALTEAPVQVPQRSGRRRMVWAMGALCAAGTGAFVLPQWLAGFPEFEEKVATARGERRAVTLPDASVIAMNTATHIDVRLYKDRRLVTLTDGEATFSVTKDASRPFYVAVGKTVVRVTGTQFNVRRNADNVRVTVLSGRVEVSFNDDKAPGQVMLGPNDAVTASDASGLGLLEKTDAASVTAWRQGRVVFFDTPLSIAIGEINRYIPQPIRITDPAVAKMRIAGVFSVDSPDSFLRLVPEIAPVVVRKHADGSALIVSR